MKIFRLFLIAFQLFFIKIVSAQAPVQIPSFAFTEVFTAKVFKTEDLKKEGLIIFNFYDTGCGHCQKMGEGIAQQIKSFKNVKFYFVAMNDPEYVNGFINMFARGLKDNPKASFLWDKDGQFISLFKPTKTPSLYIYDAKTNKLLKHMDGVDHVQDLQVALQQLIR